MKTSFNTSCGQCQNSECLETTAKALTVREESATKRHGTGIEVGVIKCPGRTVNDAIGMATCHATVERSIIPEHPKETDIMNPCATADAVPGFQRYGTIR